MYKYALLAISALAHLATAQDVCTTLDDQWYHDHTIETSADVAKYSQCSRIAGNMLLAREYSGSFELPGLIRVDNFDAGSSGGSHSTPNQGPASVTEISFPELATIDSFSVSKAVALTSISLPKLRSVGGRGGSIGLSIHLTAVKTISLPSLEEVGGYIYFEGQFDVLELPKLTSVYSLRIKTWGALDCVALYAQLKDTLTLTEPSPIWSPAFQCESSINSANSPLGPSKPITTTTASATDSATSSSGPSSTTSGSSSTFATSSSVYTSSSTSAYITTTSTHAGTNYTLSTSFTSTPTSPLVASIGGNGTVAHPTTTRRPSPTSQPPALETSAGNALRGRVWESAGLLTIVCAGLLLL